MAPKKPKRVAFYMRVSTSDQTVENQRLELAKVAEQRGWQITELYSDNGISGSKGREKRPAFDRLCKDAVASKFDIIATWSVDRLGRSLIDLLTFLREIHSVGVDLYLHAQGVDTTTPGGKALFQMMGIFAEFERAIIVERVKAGLARAKAKGKTLGRRRVDAKVEKRIREMHKAGTGKNSIARELGCGVSVVQRVLREGGDK